MEVTPGNTPDFSPLAPLTREELEAFVAQQEHYLSTDNPTRTLQMAFVEEVLEVSMATPTEEHFNHAELEEEIGDALNLGILVARNRDVPLSAVITKPTLAEFQDTTTITTHENWTPWMELAVPAMRAYESIDPSWIPYNDEPTVTDSLAAYFATLAHVATSYDITLDDAARHMMDKLKTRTRTNHAVAEVGKADKPQTHVGRYLAKAGIPLQDIVSTEQNSHHLQG